MMLEIRNFTKIFNLDQAPEFQKLALDNISLTVEDGEFVTIIGGNGSGKSTLMNMISGVYAPTSGTILIDGVDVTNKPEYERAKYLGRVFQDPMMGTASNMSISENLELAIRRGEKRTLRWGFKKESFLGNFPQLKMSLLISQTWLFLFSLLCLWISPKSFNFLYSQIYPSFPHEFLF